MDLVCTHAENRNLTLITLKCNPFTPQCFFFFKFTHFFPFICIFSSRNISDNKKAAICWLQVHGIKFLYFENHIPLSFYTTRLSYKVRFITIPLDPNPLPLQHLIVVVLLHPIPGLFKKPSRVDYTCSFFWLQRG